MVWKAVKTAPVLGLAVLVAATLLPAAPALAQSGPYVSVGGGFENRQRSGEDAFTYIDFGNDFAVNVAGGYKYQDEEQRARNLSVEGEFSYLRNNTNTVSSVATGPQPGLGNVTLRVGMVNVRYLIPIPATMFGAYVSAGVGGYKSYLNDVSNVVAQPFGFVANASSQGVTFAYQFRVGADFHLVPRADLFAGYRYLHGGDLTFLNTAFGDLRPTGARIHSLEAAVRIVF